MADELVDIYNENMERTGTATKSDAHKRGLWHRAIHCWIVRPDAPGYVLFQKRGHAKSVYPNALDISAAGHYRAGETPKDGLRELVEELGLEVPFDRLIPLGIKIDVGTVGAHIVREFCDVFLLKEDREPAQYVIGPQEVEGLVQISIPQGLALFGGRAPTAPADGVEYDSRTQTWTPITLEVTRGDVIPRVDQYYYKVFIMAARLLEGAEDLAI